jgi:hypothetical protein
MVGLVVLCAAGARGQVQTFINDFDGWAAATVAISTIDFETLPDGSPSLPGTDITDTFNYTAQGATFSSPLEDLIIGGNPVTGFSLLTSNDGTIENPAFIRADLTTAARSVGFIFGGGATFEVFDEMGGLLASEFFSGSGSGFFLGVTSDIPIEYVLMDKSISTTGIQSFHFAPVPEPGTAALLGLGAAWLLRRRGSERATS